MGISIIHSESQKILAEQIFSDIRRSIASSGKKSAVLLVPETSKLDIERAYVEFTGSSGIMDLEILSFSRFCLKVLDEVGRSGGYIDETGRAMLVYRALRSAEKDLTVFRNLCSDPRFVSGIISVIGEMRRSLVTAALLSDKSEDITDKISAAKVREISLIMSEYSSLLSESGLKDPQDRYSDAAALLASSGSLKAAGGDKWPENRLFGILGSSFFVLGFGELRDFTPQEYNIIDTIAGFTEIKISVVCGPQNKNAADEERTVNDPFGAGRRCIEGLKRRDPSALVSYIPPVSGNERRLMIINAMNTAEEISMIAGEIKRLVSEEQMRYRDIRVMTAGYDKHRNIVRDIFREAGIPLYSDEKKVMKDTALGRAVSSLIKIMRSGWRSTHVISYLRSGFSLAEQQETDRFENFMLASGIRFKSQLFDEKKYFTPDGSTQDGFAETRDRIFAGILKLDNNRHSCKTASDHCDLFNEFFSSEGYEERTGSLSAMLVAEGYQDEAVALVKAWNSLTGMIGQIRLMGIDAPMDFEGFCGLIKSGMDQAVSGTIPHYIDSVQFSPVRSIPAGNPRVLFAAGFTNDDFPGRTAEEGLLNDRDRSILSESLGIRFASHVEDKADEDIFTSYSLMRLPSELLVFSAAAEAGREAVLVRNAAETEADEVCRSRSGDKTLPDSPVYCSTGALIRAMAEIKEDRAREWMLAEKILREGSASNRKLTEIRSVRKLVRDDIKIDPDLIREKYGEVPNLSISQLERYSSCRFSHFSSYLLRLRPRELRRIESSGFGSILHSILEIAANEFAAKIKSCGNDEEKQAVLESYETADFGKFAEELMEKAVMKDLLGIFTEKGFRSAEGRTSRRIAESMLRKIFADISKEALLPSIAEWEFSAENGNALVIRTEEGRSVVFRGKIDRVDTGEGRFRIIDYKSGFSRIDKSKWHHGLSIQLPAYVAAFMNAKPGMEPEDVMYLQFGRKIVEIEGKNIACAEVRAAEKLKGGTRERNNKFTSDELKAASEHALEMASEFSGSLLRGEYAVAPRRMENEEAACRYCDYKAVCGFDKYCRATVLRRIKEDTEDA